MRLIDADALIGELHTQFFYDGRDRTRMYAKVQEQPTIAEPESRWTPCSEGSPDKADEYYVTWTTSDCPVSFVGVFEYSGYEEKGSHEIKYQWIPDALPYKNIKVTAWMPLPEPYKEKEE